MASHSSTRKSPGKRKFPVSTIVSHDHCVRKALLQARKKYPRMTISPKRMHRAKPHVVTCAAHRQNVTLYIKLPPQQLKLW